MTEKNIKETLQSKAVKTVLSYLDKDPDRNMPKLLEWTDRFDRDGLYEKLRALFHEVLKDPQCNWYRLAKSLWTDIDADVRKVFFENLSSTRHCLALRGRTVSSRRMAAMCLGPS